MIRVPAFLRRCKEQRCLGYHQPARLLGFIFLLPLVDEIVALFQCLDFLCNWICNVFTCDDTQPIPNMAFEPGVIEFQSLITGQLSIAAPNRLLKCREDLVKVIASLYSLPAVFLIDHCNSPLAGIPRPG